MSEVQTDAYARWYERNKEALSEKRKRRYREDPEYRKACLERKAKQSRARSVPPVPEVYTHNFKEAAEALDVSLYKLRNWREKGHFPEPYYHPKGRYFTEAQLNLLQELRDFHEDHSRPYSEDEKVKLQEISDLIHANW